MGDNQSQIELIDDVATDDLVTGPATGDEVVVLPETIVSGRARFPSGVTTLVKSLRSDGVEATFSHDSDHREWNQQLGEVELTFGLAVAAEMLGSGAWDVLRMGLASWFRTLPASGSRLRIDLRVDRAGRSTRLRISGSAGEVVDALERMPDVIRSLTPDEDDGVDESAD